MQKQPVSGEVRTHTMFETKFTVVYAAVCGAQSNSNSDIKDHGSRVAITNTAIMENFEILRELPKWDIEKQSERMLLKKWASSNRCCQNLLCVRSAASAQYNKVRHNKMRPAHTYNAGVLRLCRV